MEKSTLDQLRIEREPEKDTADSNPWRWLLPLILVLAAGAAAAYFLLLNPTTLPEVRTATVREISGTAASTVLNASGYVTARRAATVSSKFTGKVTEVLIEEGTRVEENQVVARLDDSNVRASYNLAVAQLDSARHSRTETEVLLVEARANLQRTQSLVERELASDQELDRTRALTNSLAAQLRRKEADLVVAQRSVDIYQRQLDDLVIRAPFSGVIISKNAQPGEMISPVSAGGGFTRTGIGTIVDMSSLEIEIDVNEAYINRVSAGQPVVATLDAYPDWQIPCHVIAIIPTADRQRATVEVRVGFDALDDRILPDMGVKVAFQESEAVDRVDTGGFLVPGAAIREANGQEYVLIVNEGVLERRAIVVSGEKGSDRLVRTGLSAATRVVVSGPADLADGDEVKEIER